MQTLNKCGGCSHGGILSIFTLGWARVGKTGHSISNVCSPSKHHAATAKTFANGHAHGLTHHVNGHSSNCAQALE